MRSTVQRVDVLEAWAFSATKASLKFAILNPKNGYTVLISRVENQIDYHTCNSSTLNHLPEPGGLPMAAKATNLCESVKPFPDRQSPDLSDAATNTKAGRLLAQ